MIKLELQNRLLTWFSENRRPLPWRDRYEPYQVWISEMMLQQTQVATVLPYFERWMRRFPTIDSVAKAGEDEILKHWEGLGYYSRALNVWKAAKIIVRDFGGEFPNKYEEILRLPGIGPYSAAAISSIAFEEDRPLVDGNVIRVLSRLYDFRENTKIPANVKYFWELAEKLLPKGKARDWNQALMEFGALNCTPKNPKCEACPIQKNCLAYKSKTQTRLPNRGPKQEKHKISVAIAVIQKDGEIFIQKRAGAGLMAGLWEFPGGQIEKDETPEQALHREIHEELGIQIKNPKEIMQIKHAYTKYLVDLHCFRAEFESGEIQLCAASEFKWVSPNELSLFPFPAANVKLIQYVVQSV